MKHFSIFKSLFILAFLSNTAFGQVSCPENYEQAPGYAGLASCSTGGKSLSYYIEDPQLSSIIALFHNEGAGVSAGSGYGSFCYAEVPYYGPITVSTTECKPPNNLRVGSTSLGLGSDTNPSVDLNTNFRVSPSEQLTIVGEEPYFREVHYRVQNTGSGSSKGWTHLVTLNPYDTTHSLDYSEMVLNLGPLSSSEYSSGKVGKKISFRARTKDSDGKTSPWKYSDAIWLYTDILASAGSYGYYQAPSCHWIKEPTQPGQTVQVTNLRCLPSTYNHATKLDRAPWSPGTNCTLIGGVSGSTCLNFKIDW